MKQMKKSVFEAMNLEYENMYNEDDDRVYGRSMPSIWYS